MSAHSPLETVFRLTTYQKSALKKLRIGTVEDLLYHFPTRYESVADEKPIALLKKGDAAIFHGIPERIKKTRAFRKKMIMTEATVKDHTGTIKAVWFHQPYIADKLKEGASFRFSGKIGERNGKLYIANPEFEDSYHSHNEKNGALNVGPAYAMTGMADRQTLMYPVYPESRGITSKWFYHAIKKLLREKVHETMTDPIPAYILKEYSLPQLKSALVWIHNPQKESHGVSARKRFAFEEVFFIQLSRQRIRHEYKSNPSYEIEASLDRVKNFTDRFPFALTKSQSQAIETILSDFKKGEPMSRLLEGDVGSGKTAVAATSAYTTVTSRPKNQDFGNLQVAYMAPTEILAQQHFESFMEYFSHMPIQIGLITGSGCKKFPSKVNPRAATTISRSQLLKWVKNGEIPILIGTHALIQKTVSFKHLAFIIIDEQHRFGTMQRAKLSRKNDGVYAAPHLLSMTATPIPRTLALTIFGDLDLTLLDEMPAGRKPIITEIISPNKRATAYETIAKRLMEGRQLYVICPRIDEPDPKKLLALNTKSVKAEALRLKKEVFREFEIEILHSKMKPAEKEKVMKKFSDGDIDILVATSVVEVGVNVPNATMIIIEGAERFGLAQLHQLRGRVLRSNHQAYCYIFADTKSKKSIERLRAIQKAKSGFELAEYDLEMRGSGELSGRRQWGISDIGMEAIKNIKMVEAARHETQSIIAKDPELTSYPLLNERLSKDNGIHFE